MFDAWRMFRCDAPDEPNSQACVRSVHATARRICTPSVSGQGSGRCRRRLCTYPTSSPIFCFLLDAGTLCFVGNNAARLQSQCFKQTDAIKALEKVGNAAGQLICTFVCLCVCGCKKMTPRYACNLAPGCISSEPTFAGLRKKKKRKKGSQKKGSPKKREKGFPLTKVDIA